MSLTDRDKKIVMAIVPLLVLAAYWFLLLAPKREEAATAAEELTQQEQRRDSAKQLADQASAAKTDFAADYGEIVRLGKAIPSRVDMPSLLVQLDRAADGTGIAFTKISTGERTSVAAPASSSSSSSAPPAAAGGAPAQSAPGTATEAANTAANTSEQRSSAAESSGVSPADAQTSTSARNGGLPVGGGSVGSGSGTATASAPPALETVPLQLEFQGNFFRLADFFHDIKRFVHVVNENVVVNGRLVTIEGVNFVSDPVIFPRIRAELKATIYLSPLAQGATAGATPQGPAATTPAGTAPAPNGGSPSAPTPTAAATP